MGLKSDKTIRKNVQKDKEYYLIYFHVLGL
jgi:hypothetical protein